MKVLHVSTWRQRCGIADYAASLVEHLAPLGVSAAVFPLNTAALKYATDAERREQMAQAPRMAAGCDLVHVQHEFTIFAGAGGLFESIWNFSRLLVDLRNTGRPVVVTFHSEPAFSGFVPAAPRSGSGGSLAAAQNLVQELRRRRVIGKLERLWRKDVASFFDGSRGNFRGLVHNPRTRSAIARSGIPAASISVLPLGHTLRDRSFLSADRAQAKASLGLPADSVLLTIFGFVTAYKGHLVAVEALKKLPPRFHLAVVGGPHPANQSDRTLNTMLEMWEGEDPGRLMITGFAPRDTIDRYHAATDLCLAPFLPGNTAGSASATWAFTSGRPTIASNIPAFAEIHEATDCLELVTPGAVHELCWQIQRLADDPVRQEQLVRNALQFAEENSWPRIAGRLAELYCEMTARSGARLPDDQPQPVSNLSRAA